jgi:hypothetical protein
MKLSPSSAAAQTLCGLASKAYAMAYRLQTEALQTEARNAWAV